MEKKKPATADYEVVTAREIAGSYRPAGAVVPMSPAQAKYYLPPHGTGLKPVAAKAAAKSKAEAPKPAPKAAATES